MAPRRIGTSVAILALLLLGLPGHVTHGADPALLSTPVSDGFQQVGHNPLLGRGMNAAIALHDGYVYVGSRTDASAAHESPGVLVVDVRDPAAPSVVGQIGPPNAGNSGESSRELRVWPQQDLLAVLNIACDVTTHACSSASVVPRIDFYDISTPAAPVKLGSYRPSAPPHEMFLWTDGDDRALLYLSTWKTAAGGADLIVTDISKARAGVFTELATYNGNALFDPATRSADVIRLHSVGLSPDGTRAHVAYQGGGMFELDTSDLALGMANPVVRQLTPHGSQPRWGNPGAHSGVEVPAHSNLVLTTDEVYGNRPGGGFQSRGCPWGWVRLIDTSAPATPVVISEYRSAQNTTQYCEGLDGRNPLNTWYTSYSAHNPTLVEDLAFVTWHSAGLHAIDLADPRAPKRAGLFIPTPEQDITTEDPALSAGLPKTVLWSYPIISGGLIYVIDVRNGLYILRYTGPRAAVVADVEFLEGNSNLGTR